MTTADAAWTVQEVRKLTETPGTMSVWCGVPGVEGPVVVLIQQMRHGATAAWFTAGGDVPDDAVETVRADMRHRGLVTVDGPGLVLTDAGARFVANLPADLVTLI